MDRRQNCVSWEHVHEGLNKSFFASIEKDFNN